MLGHLGLNVADLDAARRYWAVLMPMLGFEPFLDDAAQIAYRPADGKHGTYVFIYGALDGAAVLTGRGRVAAPGVHGPHAARQSHDVYRAALELGSETVHEPQVFPQYPQPYFAAFWRDPAGFTIEAVCHHDR